MQISDVLITRAVCEDAIPGQLFLLDDMPCNEECVNQIRGILLAKLSDVFDIFFGNNDIMEACFLERELDCYCFVCFKSDERDNTRHSLDSNRSKQPSQVFVAQTVFASVYGQ